MFGRFASTRTPPTPTTETDTERKIAHEIDVLNKRLTGIVKARIMYSS